MKYQYIAFKRNRFKLNFYSFSDPFYNEHPF